MATIDDEGATGRVNEGETGKGNEGAVDALVQLAPECDFDWETYISSYTGRTRFERLLFIASKCPQLRIPCSTAAIQLIQAMTTDVTLYNQALHLRNTSAQQGQPLLSKEQRMAADQEWCSERQQSNQNELEKLDLELRHYQNNLIKESVRMAHRDLGDHLRSMGNLGEALKYYIKTRDHCSTSEHVVEMCINVIEVSLELNEYQAISAYVSKAEGLLDSYNPLAAASSGGKSSAKLASSTGPANKGGSTSGADAIGALFRAGGSAGSTGSATLSSASAQLASTSTAAHREAEAQGKRQVAEIRSKLNVAQGIAYLGTAKYSLARSQLLEVDVGASEAFSNMASRADVAMYIVLCSLAVLDRRELTSSVIDRPNIASVLEWDTQARDLLDCFYACDYKKTLALLEKVKARSLLDIHLSRHYSTLVGEIVRRALRQCVQPFDTLCVSRLATSMGWHGKEGEERAMDQLIGLIQKREIDGKLDIIDRVYHANKKDSRQALFDGALQTGQQRTTSAKRLVLRMNLLQSSLVVRLPNERAET